MDNQEKEIKYENIEKKNDLEKKEDEFILQNKKNQELKEKILINKKKIHDLKLRHLANIENIKKNFEKKIKNIKIIEMEMFFEKIIPVINSLEDILETAEKLHLQDEPLIQGIKLTLKSFLTLLCKFGVKIEGKKDEIFDPKIHSAILLESSSKKKSNCILSVKKKGFSFNKKILRKAIVIIPKN